MFGPAVRELMPALAPLGKAPVLYLSQGLAWSRTVTRYMSQRR
jgi:hypothetical protein